MRIPSFSLCSSLTLALLSPACSSAGAETPAPVGGGAGGAGGRAGSGGESASAGRAGAAGKAPERGGAGGAPGGSGGQAGGASGGAGPSSTCAALGGNTCVAAGDPSCAGRKALGASDCQICCKVPPTCAELGGNACVAAGDATCAGLSDLMSSDCAVCCKATATRTCAELGGDACKPSGSHTCDGLPALLSTDCAACCRVPPACTDADIAAGPPDAGVADKHVLAEVTCPNTQLRYRPADDAPDNEVLGLSPSLLQQGRYVVIQPIPGRFGAYAWISPDLPSSDRPRLEAHGIKLPPSYGATYPDVARRGWVPVSCLKTVIAGEGMPADNAGDFRPADLGESGNADGAPFGGPSVARHIKHHCAVSGAFGSFKNAKPQNDMSGDYAPFGVLHPNEDALYIVYSTPGVPDGGVPFGYLAGGAPFHVAYTQACRDINQDPSWLDAGSPPARWVYGFGKVNGLDAQWGWVRADCVE